MKTLASLLFPFIQRNWNCINLRKTQLYFPSIFPPFLVLVSMNFLYIFILKWHLQSERLSSSLLPFYFVVYIFQSYVLQWRNHGILCNWNYIYKVNTYFKVGYFYQAKARFSRYNIERESTLYMNFTRLIYKDQRESLTATECFLIIGFGIKPPNWQILKAKEP